MEKQPRCFAAPQSGAAKGFLAFCHHMVIIMMPELKPAPGRELFLPSGRTIRDSDAEIFLRRKAASSPVRIGTATPFGVAVFVLKENGKREETAMENRIAAISILVSETDSVEKLNALLHTYGEHIIGRMGIPYRQRGVNIICLAMDAPADVINALTGKIGRLPGVTAKAAYTA